MGNCLVTKLKGTVDNDNLLKLGEFKLECNPDVGYAYSNVNNIVISNSKAMRIRSNFDIIGTNGANWGRDYTVPANSKVWLHAFEKGQYLIISEKYTITELSAHKQDLIVDLSEINYMQDLSTFYLYGWGKYKFIGEYDAAKFKDAATVMFVTGKTKNINLFTGDNIYVAGDINSSTMEDFPNHPISVICIADNVNGEYLIRSNLAGLSFSGCTGISGNLNSMGSCAGLKSFLGSGSGTWSLSLEAFVANKRAAGVTQDAEGVSILWASANGNTTFNGAPIEHAGEKKLTWTATTITFDGVTINA